MLFHTEAEDEDRMAGIGDGDGGDRMERHRRWPSMRESSSPSALAGGRSAWGGSRSPRAGCDGGYWNPAGLTHLDYPQIT